MTLEERKEYIHNAMLDMIKADSDLLTEVCEELDSWDGFLGDDRCYSMDEIDEILDDRRPSEVLNMVTSDFNYNDDYFYFNGYGNLESCNCKEDHYLDVFTHEEILDTYLDKYYHCDLSIKYDDFEKLAEEWNDYTEEDVENESDEEFTERIDELVS
jgi:hypothetical protein